MELNRYKIIFLLVVLASTLQAQRFVDEMFSVDITQDVVFANNISVLSGTPAPIDLTMDVYTPASDTETERPLVILFHSGSFLPPIINGQITGAKRDSAVAEIARRLTRRGYVVASATYRQGWRPDAVGPDGQNIRTGTLLNASYRGIQDARSCIRFFRNTVENEGNPWGVDPEKIVLWGQGTGGYLAYGAAFLDRNEEINLEKFIDTDTAENFIDFALSSNVFGDTNTPLNIANNPDQSNDFAMAVNMGGALGDKSWIDGQANEPVIIGFHCLRDPFAPFADGPVIVPTTRDFVVNVSGTRTVVGLANGEEGSANINTALAGAESDPSSNPAIEGRNGLYQTIPIDFLGQQTTLSTDHMYPFISDGLLSGPWDYVDVPTLRATVAGTNAALGTNFSADTLIANTLITNPTFSRETGMAYLDTITQFFIPRAFLALNLETVGVNEIPLVDAGMLLAPNPSTSSVRITTDNEYEMIDLGVYNMAGKLVQSYIGINTTDLTIHRENLAPGMYLVKARFDEGVQASKILFQ